MNIGLPEFTFGYAYLYEQTVAKWGELTAAPTLPSLYQEAKEGWDAKLPTRGTAFFYQFKVSDWLFRRNATLDLPPENRSRDNWSPPANHGRTGCAAVGSRTSRSSGS